MRSFFIFTTFFLSAQAFSAVMMYQADSSSDKVKAEILKTVSDARSQMKLSNHNLPINKVALCSKVAKAQSSLKMAEILYPNISFLLVSRSYNRSRIEVLDLEKKENDAEMLRWSGNQMTRDFNKFYSSVCENVEDILNKAHENSLTDCSTQTADLSRNIGRAPAVIEPEMERYPSSRTEGR